MNLEQPTNPSNDISSDELRCILEFLYRVMRPGMRPQLVGVVLTNQASAEELSMAFRPLDGLAPANPEDQNLRLLIQFAPCLEIIRRYAHRLATRRRNVLDPTDVPPEALIDKFLARHHVEIKQRFVEERSRFRTK
jgi:hypothetical protein